MKVEKNVSLKKHNTFGINVKAAQYLEVQTLQELKDILTQKVKPLHILGGGSNLLLTKKLKGLVLKVGLKGKKVDRVFKHCVYVEAGAGENWHEFVCWCIENDFGGVENLSLIPGTVGAAPIQNIGAYGVELKDVFHKLEAIHIPSGKIMQFRKKQCEFAYRNSYFKQNKGNYIITKVWFKLSKPDHVIHLAYGAIKTTLSEMKIKQPTIKEVSQAVIKIRSSKLPDPAKIGNSGSFFKNPEISRQQFIQLQKQFPQIVHYDLPNKQVKIPAGWLIEQCGWKGKRIGNTGTHANQALVLVNYGNATGKEIYKLAKKIQKSVLKKYDILLEMEVNVW